MRNEFPKLATASLNQFKFMIMEKWIEEKMRGAKSVRDWNELREEVKHKLQSEYDNKTAMGMLGSLDQSGLIVEVLGKDQG